MTLVSLLAVLAGTMAMAPTALSDQSWSSGQVIDASSAPSSVSCPSASFCAAVDLGGNVLTFNGYTWTSPQSVDGNTAIHSVACVSAAFCAAVDDSGNVLTYDGQQWSTPQTVDGGNTLESVSCASITFCVAVDNNGNALTYDGSQWTSSSIDAGEILYGVSCPSSSFCAAVDYSGDAVRFNGNTWTLDPHIDGNIALSAVSCPSTSYCVATDQSGNVLTYNGSGWSSPQSLGQDPLVAISCPSTSFCAATGEHGTAAVFNGQSWSTPVNVTGPESQELSSVSCLPTPLCTAVDGSGDAYTYPYSASSATPAPSGGLPAISGLVVKPSGFDAGSLDSLYVGYSLSAPASVHLVLEVKKGGTFVPFAGAGVTLSGGSGPNTSSIGAMQIAALSNGAAVTVRKLKTGTYRLEATPSSSAGTGQTVHADFIVKPPKTIIIVNQPLKVSGSGTRHATGRVVMSDGSVWTLQIQEKWKTKSGAYTLLAPGAPASFGGPVGSSTLLEFGALGSAEFSSSPRKCGPEEVHWALKLDLRELPAPRVEGLSSKLTCNFTYANTQTPVALNDLFTSSSGHLKLGFNKIKCKKKNGKITDCKIKPSSTLKFVGTSTSTYCGSHTPFSFLYAQLLALCSRGAAAITWRDTESWDLTIKAGLPKCYEVTGNKTKKVSCPPL